MLTDWEWTGRYAVKLNDGINGIFTLRGSIDNGFDANGRVRYPLEVRITGNIDAVTELFATCGWVVTPRDEDVMPYEFLLMIIA